MAKQANQFSILGLTTTEGFETTTQAIDSTTEIHTTGSYQETTTQQTTESNQHPTEATTENNREETTNQQTTETNQETTTHSLETTEGNREETTNQHTTEPNQDTSTYPLETTTGGNSEETTIHLTTTESVQETTTQVVETTNQQTTQTLETTNQQTTESVQETTYHSVETTTDVGGTETTENTDSSTTQPPLNGNSSCPPIEEGQAHYVCPTGFRRHPQDCAMFYQCTQSPETSHLSIVTFNCPNGTVYDEDAIQCRDRQQSDNCPTKSQNAALLKGTIFDIRSDHEESPVVRKAQTIIFKLTNSKSSFQIQIRTKRSLCSTTGHFTLEENDSCSSTFLRCGKSNSGKMEGRVYRCPSGYVYWQKSRRCERSVKVPDCQQKFSRQRLGVPVEWTNLGRRRSLQL